MWKKDINRSQVRYCNSHNGGYNMCLHYNPRYYSKLPKTQQSHVQQLILWQHLLYAYKKKIIHQCWLPGSDIHLQRDTRHIHDHRGWLICGMFQIERTPGDRWRITRTAAISKPMSTTTHRHSSSRNGRAGEEVVNTVCSCGLFLMMTRGLTLQEWMQWFSASFWFTLGEVRNLRQRSNLHFQKYDYFEDNIKKAFFKSGYLISEQLSFYFILKICQIIIIFLPNGIKHPSYLYYYFILPKTIKKGWNIPSFSASYIEIKKPNLSLYIVLQLPLSDWTFCFWASSFTLSVLSDSCPLITQHVFCWSEAGPYHWGCPKGWAGNLGWSLTVPGSGGGTPPPPTPPLLPSCTWSSVVTNKL